MNSTTIHIKQFFVGCLVLFSAIAYGQLGLSHYTFDSKDGLNASHIYGIVQDSEGTIWVGTSSGLLEFNGVRFKAVDMPGLKNLEVLQLKIDEDDTIWFVNLANQLCRYSRREGFKSVQLQNQTVHTETWINNNLVGVYGNISVGKLYDKYTLLEVTTDPFYLLSQDKTLKLGLNNTLVFEGSHIKLTDLIARRAFNLISFFDNEYLQFKSNQNLYKIIKGPLFYTLEKVNLYKNPLVLNSFTKVSDSLIHINTSVGVLAYDEKFNLKHHYYENINCTNSILDDEHNLWVSTMDRGIYFSHFSEIRSVKHFENSSISELHSSKSSLWIGTQNGESSTLDESNKVKTISSQPGSGPVRFIIENSVNQIIIGQNGTLSLCDDNGDIHNQLPASITSSCQKKAAFLTKNQFVVGTCNNSIIYKLNEKTIRQNQNYLQSVRVYSMFFDEFDSSLIINSGEGSYKYDKNFRRQQFFKDILTDNITTIKIDRAPNGILWIASSTSGIYGIDEDQIKYHFDKDNLLNTNSVNDLYISPSNELWISTTSGVNVIDSTYTKSSFIMQKDGLLSNIVHKITHWNNEVYVGTSKGLNVFNKETNFNNLTPPPIYLDEVLVDGELNDLLELTGSEVNYRFKFHGINFSSLGAFQYKYRMKGLSDTWENITSDVEEIVYNKLPPNDYTFEIFAVNEDQIESLSPATISFAVPEPFYQRWWFYFLAFCISLFVIIAIFQSRIKQLNRKNRIEQEIRSHQLTALKAQMKPHFISNILNSIQSHSMLQDPMMVNSYITKLSSFVRKVLNMSDSETVSLESELAVLKNYIELEQLRSGYSFKYDIEIEPSINTSDYYIPPMLIQPYVENAIKHGMKGGSDDLLKLQFSINPKGLLIVSIIDNGLGINQSKQRNHKQNGHISMGSEINSDRINLLRMTYRQHFSVNTINRKNESMCSTGTEVILKIPNIFN